MNLTMIRSGDSVFVNVEYIKGYAFKSAIVGEKSTHFYQIAMAANGSSFASTGVVI